MKYRLRSILIILLIVLISTASVSCKEEALKDSNKAEASNIKITWKRDVDSNTDQFRRIYKKARILEDEKHYKDAYDLFNVLDANYHILYDFVLYHRANVAKQIPDEASVIKDLSTLIKETPDSPLAGAATYALGQSYVRIKDDEKAQKYFEICANKYPNTDFAVASDYYLGELMAKLPEKKEKAIQSFLTYLKEAPDGKFAVNSAEAVIKLKGEANLSSYDKELIGLAYFNGGQYSNAIKYLEPAFGEHTWYALGRSYQLSGNKTLAIQTFSKALNSFSGLDPEEIDNAVKAAARMKGYDYSAWEYCKKTFPKQADIALYFQAQRLYNNQAVGIYKQIIEKFPESRYAPEANWVVFWNDFNNKNYDSAITLGKNHVKNYPESKSTSRIVFWVAKAYERKGEKENAIKVYQRLANKFLGDYYAYRATGRLNELKNNKKDKKWSTIPQGYTYDISWDSPLPESLEEISTKYGNKVAELLYLDDVEGANLILGEKADAKMQSYFNLRNGLHSKSIVVLRDNQEDEILLPPGQVKAWELLYPLHFSDIIKAHATKNSIDPLLVQALTREESYFNPQAVSCSNAKGLMQLMPATASSVAQWEKIPSFSQLDLFKPEVNIRLGSRYLGYTHNTFSGNSMLAVAAYNGGPGNVNKWLKTISTDDWDQFVENIPLDETRNYVRKVFSSYWAYRDIYAKS